MICGQDYHEVFTPGLHHDDFGMTPSFHMLGLRDGLGGKRLRMMQDFVGYFALIQKVGDRFWYRHKISP
jgi:hypothetical protein